MNPKKCPACGFETADMSKHSCVTVFRCMCGQSHFKPRKRRAKLADVPVPGSRAK